MSFRDHYIFVLDMGAVLRGLQGNFSRFLTDCGQDVQYAHIPDLSHFYFVRQWDRFHIHIPLKVYVLVDQLQVKVNSVVAE